MNVEVLEDWNAISALEGEWNPLLVASRANTIFLTWEWISSWMAIGGRHQSPFVICIRSAKRDLVGVAPFYLSTLWLGCTIPYRTLRILADTATGAEYADWIVRPDVEQEVTQTIASALADARSRWDCLWMPKVAGWTGAIERVMEQCQHRALLSRSRPCEFGAVTLPDTMDTYVRSLSSNKRQQLRGEMKRISGRQGVRVHRCETVEEIPHFLDALFDLHHRRWKTKGEVGSFRRKPQLEAFYKQFVPLALAKKWLWLFALEDGGEVKAVQLGYVYNKAFYQIQEGFDPEYVKGVGNVLRARVIEACIEAGVCTFDFLGEMSEHKRRWRAETRVGYDIFVGHRKLKNSPLFSADIWPTGRFLRPAA